MNSHKPVEELSIRLAKALVHALQSEEADIVIMEETQEFMEQLGDTITLPVSGIMDLDQLSLDERRQLLHSIFNGLGVSLDQSDWQNDPQLCTELQNSIWHYFQERSLNNCQVMTSHMELLRGALDFRRPIRTTEGVWMLIYVDQGETLAEYGQHQHRIGRGGPEVVLLPPNTTVNLDRNPDCDYCSIFSSTFFPKSSWLPWLQFEQQSDALRTIRVQDPRIRDYLREAFSRIIDIAHSSLDHTRILHLNLLEHILILLDGAKPQQQTQLDPRVIAARDYLLQHYTDKITVEQVAAVANTSASTLTALFKNQMGSNLMKWRDQLRVQRARELLQETDLPIKVIASQVGYEDPMFFSRRFKQLTGWSPTQIRSDTD